MCNGLAGAIMVLSPVPFLLSAPGVDGFLPAIGWQFWFAALSSFLCGLCAVTLCRRPVLGKWIGAGAVIAGYVAIIPLLAGSPFAALVGLVCLVSIGFVLNRSGSGIVTGAIPTDAAACLQRARGGAFSLLAVAAVWFMFASSPGGALYCALAAWIAQGIFLHWAVSIRSWWRIAAAAAGMAFVGLVLSVSPAQHAVALVLMSGLACLLMLPTDRRRHFDADEPWWEILMDHPGRILITSFSLLCLAGALLLSLPSATTQEAVAFIDAAFTSVSAVCVTGLIVLDTPNDFTLAGQFLILVLIQLGGLGIMSITTVALHAMGKRLSLRHEKMLTSMRTTSHQDLIGALGAILKFTLIAEMTGAVILTLAFAWFGDAPAQAVWRGVFTAVSAFCNAGFSLQSDSLVAYQSTPLVLHTVAVLIVLGGMAPATSLMIPGWLAGKPVPASARIVLVTTVVLLLGGTFFMLAFEWNRMLAGLSFLDKCQNAWFHSVTLRTAGFNALDMGGMSSPAYLVMLIWMFIGGSPGGTAGGVKTTSIGLLSMTFWANISNQRKVVVHGRCIQAESVYRAITVVIAGAMIWMVVVVMLAVTQSLPFRDLVFEATSAIGTVGLSTGGTQGLDEIGKVIIMVAMFAGRIGPVSLFMLLDENPDDAGSRYPMEYVKIEG
jgi:trk system potassium uptake protein TrkH